MILSPVWKIHKARTSKKWLTSCGVIVSSDVICEYIDAAYYKPKIVYKYSVNGKEYFSSEYTFGESSWIIESKAHEVVNSYEQDMSIIIYYNPNNPSEAVLLREVSEDYKPFFIFAIIVTFIGLLMTIDYC